MLKMNIIDGTCGPVLESIQVKFQHGKLRVISGGSGKRDDSGDTINIHSRVPSTRILIN